MQNRTGRFSRLKVCCFSLIQTLLALKENFVQFSMKQMLIICVCFIYRYTFKKNHDLLHNSQNLNFICSTKNWIIVYMNFFVDLNVKYFPKHTEDPSNNPILMKLWEIGTFIVPYKIYQILSSTFGYTFSLRLVYLENRIYNMV